MKKLLLLLIAIVAMGKLANAQCGPPCTSDQECFNLSSVYTSCGDCGCMTVDNDPSNCGSIGRECQAPNTVCAAGVCTCDGGPECEPLITAKRPPKLVAFHLRPKHSGVTRALALLVRKE